MKMKEWHEERIQKPGGGWQTAPPPFEGRKKPRRGQIWVRCKNEECVDSEGFRTVFAADHAALAVCPRCETPKVLDARPSHYEAVERRNWGSSRLPKWNEGLGVWTEGQSHALRTAKSLGWEPRH